MRWAAKTESNLLEDNSGREIREQTGFDELLATWALHWHHVHKLCSAGGKGKQTQGVVCWSRKEFSTPRFCLQVTTSHPITLWQTRYPRRIQIIPILKNTQLKEIKPDTYNSYSLIAERQTLTSINWPMTSWQTVPQHWATARLKKGHLWIYLSLWDFGIIRGELSGQSQELSSFQEAWSGRHGAGVGKSSRPLTVTLASFPGD